MHKLESEATKPCYTLFNNCIIVLMLTINAVILVPFYRKFDWKKLGVPITHINHCHLIDHEEQLYPIILSHCQYSLKAGHGQEIQYDFAGLEKHILKRFIFGKPTILLDIPHVRY